MSEPKKIFLIAGENSGDQPAGRLVREVLRLRPDWQLTGLGGPQMENAGMLLLRNMIHDLAIVGIVEVITKAPQIIQVYRMVKRYLIQERPDVVILIDYPGFNLKLVAPLAHKLGIRVIYYIVPTFWAWDYDRVYKLKEYCDRIFPVFPFEEEMLRKVGINAKYLGSKDLDQIVLTQTRDQIFERFKLDPDKKLVGLLPGSRRREVNTLLPIMLEAAERLAAVRDDVQFILPRAATIPLDLIDTYLSQYDVAVKVIDDNRLNTRAAMDFSWVASGTAATEGALIGIPFVIVYKLNYMTYWIAKRLINTPYAGIPNIVAGEMVVPELLQEQATGLNLAEHAQHYLDDEQAYQNMKYQLRKIREKFGEPGSSKRLAAAVVEFLEKKKGKA
jgi:lipid-A-disaccharide synthase